jgi:molybdopterin converting factor subunit 1
VKAAATRRVRVQYFAVLREEAGVSEEAINTSAATMAELYDEISARHGFVLPRARLKVVVNEEFDHWTRPVCEGDVVVFIPPVAGG